MEALTVNFFKNFKILLKKDSFKINSSENRTSYRKIPQTPNPPES
jgi:hypothetical protein